MVKDEDHKGIVGNALPLAVEPVIRGRYESEAGVVLGMPKDDDKGTTRGP